MLIYFIGYLAAGKEKWGRKLAKRLEYDFIDTREMMMDASGLDFFTLLQNKELFIKLEQEVLNKVSKLKNTVVATSELLPCRGNNMEIMNNTGITFYLRAGLGCIMMRIGKNTNKYPMLRGIDPDFIPDFIKMELENRKPYYEKANIRFLARELNEKKLLELLKPFMDS
jgi:shikimate kinase